MNIVELLLLIIAGETTFLTYQSFHSGASSPDKKTAKIICDTSALIDGRLVSVARSGFLAQQIIIPRSVIRELQFMADRADHDKRERARYGLDVVAELQSIPHVKVTIYDDGTTHKDGVDEQLLVLAKKLSARLCTTDYNLNKVARTEHVVVVNVNELAHALRPMHLPGEVVTVAIVTPGQNKDQGVGYLDDGTMVVVDHAKSMIGQQISAETTRIIQTDAGRMLFARIPGGAPVQSTANDTSRASSSPQGGRGRSRKPMGPRRQPNRESDLIALVNK